MEPTNEPNSVPADTVMATGTDSDTEMTIADKHTGDTLPDPDGDGELTKDEAAQLLGANANDSETENGDNQ